MKHRHNQFLASKWSRCLRNFLLASLTCLVSLNSANLFRQPVIAKSVTTKELRKAASNLTIEAQELYHRGEFDSAALMWQKTADIYDQLADEPHKKQNLINVAEAFQANGRYLKACDVAIQVVDVGRLSCRNLLENKASDQKFSSWLQTLNTKNIKHAESTTTTFTTTIKVNGLTSFGDILQKLGRIDLSDQVLQTALAIARQSSLSQQQKAILLSLGNNQQVSGDRLEQKVRSLAPQNVLPVSCKLSNNVEALSFYQQALALYEEAADNAPFDLSDWLKIELNRLSLLVKIDAKPEANQLAQNILLKLDELDELPLNSSSIYTQIKLAKNLACLQQQAEKTHSSPQAVKLLIITVILSQQLGDVRSESNALGHLGWLAWQGNNSALALSKTEQALSLAQLNNARDLAYKWQWQLGYLLEKQGDLPQAIAAYREAVRLLQLLRQDLIGIKVETRFAFQEQVEPVHRQLVELLLRTQKDHAPQLEVLQEARNTIESLKLLELEDYLQKPCLQPKVSIDSLIDQDNASAAIIYPIVLQEKIVVMLRLPNQNKLAYFSTNIPQAKFAEATNQLEAYLPDITRSFEVKQLSQQLYSWLIKPLESELLNSKIDTLVFVPDRYLGNIPLAVLYDNEAQKYLIEKYAIAIAPNLQLVNSQQIDNSALKVLTAAVSRKRTVKGKEFASLPNVQQEISNIKAKISRNQNLIDRDFTKINLESKIRDNSFSIIHLATHGQFSSNLDQTFILAWDNLLSIEDLVNLLQSANYQDRQQIKLLVLSACKTAQGDRLATLGLAGISIRSGVSSTLATLWSVDDYSTAQIMNQFYQKLDQGLTIAQAIRKAQISLLRQQENPYYWSPFVLVGNWL